VAILIPENPDDYLDAINNPRSLDWESDYGHTRHLYVPAFHRLAQEIAPGISCPQLQKAIRPLIPVTELLIPDGLKARIHASQPDDWIDFSDDQIRDAWAPANMIFAKIVMCLVSLQVFYFVKSGALGDAAAVKKLTDSPIAFKAALDSVEEPRINVLKNPNLQLATYRFSSHDPKHWNEDVFANEELRSSFRNETLQKKPAFAKSFAAGALATKSTLETIAKWHKKILDKPLGEIMYDSPDLERIKAAQKERVREIKTREKSLPRATDEMTI